MQTKRSKEKSRTSTKTLFQRCLGVLDKVVEKTVLFLSVCHVAGNGLFVGGTSDSVEADMELVACTITFGAFSANI